MFINDRDLLVAEPNLFRDVVWVGQRLCRGTASTLNTTLTMTAPDTDFVAASVTTGHVVVVDGAAYEVIERIDGSVLTVSRLRPDAGDPPIPVPPIEDKPAWVVTFAPQIAVIHRQILRMLEVEPSASPSNPSAPLESSITNPQDLAAMEIFGTLYLVMSAAAATSGPQSPLGIRAAFYRSLFSQERARAAALLDLDGDGVAENVRRLNVAFLRRI